MFPEVELLDLMVVLFLIFWEISVPFSVVAAAIYIPMYSANEESVGCLWAGPLDGRAAPRVLGLGSLCV